jgi:hypothetical protein
MIGGYSDATGKGPSARRCTCTFSCYVAPSSLSTGTVVVDDHVTAAFSDRRFGMVYILSGMGGLLIILQ